MAAPVLIFDHIHGKVGIAGGDPTSDGALAEALRDQQAVVSTAAGTPPPKAEEKHEE